MNHYAAFPHFKQRAHTYLEKWLNSVFVLVRWSLKLPCFLHRIYQKLLSIFLANMGKSLSVH